MATASNNFKNIFTMAKHAFLRLLINSENHSGNEIAIFWDITNTNTIRIITIYENIFYILEKSGGSYNINYSPSQVSLPKDLGHVACVFWTFENTCKISI